MKNTIKLFVVIALVALIGFSMTACNNGSTKDSLTITVEATTGSLTVSGLDSYKGKWFVAEGKNVSVMGAENITSNGITGALISNSGVATLKVWTFAGSEENVTFGNYNGDDSVDFGFGIFTKATISTNEFVLLIKEEATFDWVIAGGTADGVIFTGGSASATYSP